MLNHIVSHHFPNNEIKNIEDIPNLKNSMLTITKKKLIDTINNKHIISKNVFQKPNVNIEFSYENESKPNEIKDSYFKPKQKDTLFWCLYILKYDFTNYKNLINFGNTELDEKSKCVKYIDNNIPTLKSCNIKITNVNVKEIKSELLTEHVYTSFHVLCAFVCHFNFNIYIIHDSKKFFIKFTNDFNTTNHILLKDNKSYKIMHSNIANKDLHSHLKHMHCLDHFNKPIKGIGSYKLDDVISIAKNLGIDTANKKKSEIYHEIRMMLIWE
tara:strand:- start:3658 stop:4467 length:810 start_codon:yes stop_codon:yes gene_type:complete